MRRLFIYSRDITGVQPVLLLAAIIGSPLQVS